MELDARQRHKATKMSREEFLRFCRPNWAPVKIERDELPSELSGLPDKVLAVFGSGSLDDRNPQADPNPDRGQVGGIDVYREAEAEDGVKFNKDWYAVHYDPRTPNTFYLLGPKRDAEHWIDEIPTRLVFADPSSVEQDFPPFDVPPLGS